jgi:hypothetical protein
VDYQQQTLEKLERFQKEFSAHQQNKGGDFDELYMLYGELEEVINRFAGVEQIEIPPISLGMKPTIFPNYIAARLLSGRTMYGHMRHILNY